MKKMFLTEGVNEDASRRDSCLSEASEIYFLSSDGGESDGEERAHSFDFDTGSWLYKENDLRISKRLIILQETLNRMLHKKNSKDHHSGKQSKFRSSPIRRSNIPYKIENKESESESESALRQKSENEPNRKLGKETKSDSNRILGSNSLQSDDNPQHAALSATNSSSLNDEPSKRTSTARGSTYSLSFSDLLYQIPMSAEVPEDDTQLIPLALSSLRFREELFNVAKVYKHADTSEPGSESLKNLFKFILRNLPLQDTEDKKRISELLVFLNKFEEGIITKTANFHNIFAEYKTFTPFCEDSKREKKFSTDIATLIRAFDKIFLQSSNKIDLSEDEVLTVIGHIHLFIKLLVKEAFYTLFIVYCQVTHIKTLLILEVNEKKSLLEEALDFLQQSIKGFTAKFLKCYDASLEEDLEVLVVKKLENLKENINETFVFQLDAAIEKWRLTVNVSLCTYFTIQYNKEYPQEKELSDSSSIKASKMSENPGKVFSYKEKREKDLQTFKQKIIDLFEKLLNNDSFLSKNYFSSNRELVFEFYELYSVNTEQKKKIPSEFLASQLQRKNICTAEIEFTFDGNLQVSIPLFEPNAPVFNYTMLELATREDLNDITNSSAVMHALSRRIPLYCSSSNIHHSEQSVVGFVIENACLIVQILLKKLGNSKENIKKMTNISLNLHSLRNICETCTILLSHKLVKLFMRLYKKLKKHINLEIVPDELQKMTKRIGFTSFPRKIPKLQDIETSLFLKEDQMSFLNYEFLKRSVLLTQDDLKSYQANRTYFVSAPSDSHSQSLKFYKEQVLPFEVAAANKLNGEKESQESEK